MTTVRQAVRRSSAAARQREGMAGPAFLLLAGAASPLLADLLVATLGLGPLSRHMTTHILLMGLVAPALAHALLRSGRGEAAWHDMLRRHLPVLLLAATLLQLLLLWGWHAPPALELSHGRPLLHLAMQGTLLAAALWFWLAVFAERGAGRWRAILALLITGKLFCLLGVILVFAPRTLYALHVGHAVPSGQALADQQLAGLLMLTACPLTYLVAGVAIAAGWLNELASGDSPREASTVRETSAGGHSAGGVC